MQMVSFGKHYSSYRLRGGHHLGMNRGGGGGGGGGGVMLKKKSSTLIGHV